MARQEENREDLLRDATALVERAELKIPCQEDPVFVGFRKDGAASFYFGQDRVYHFNAAGQLRRAFVDGLLYKSEGGKLCSLRRERSARESVLLSHELAPAEEVAFLAELNAHLSVLANSLRASTFTVTGQVPADWPVANRLKLWLTADDSSVTIAARPGV